MSLLAVAGANSASGGYDVDNSLKFELIIQKIFIEILNGSTSTTKFTFYWLKRTELTNALCIYMRGVAGNNQ